MLVKTIVEKMKEIIKEEVGEQVWEEYMERDEMNSNEIERLYSRVAYHSHNKSRDCDHIKLTKNYEPLEREIHTFDDKRYDGELYGKSFYTEHELESFSIDDIDDNVYTLHIMSDDIQDMTEEVE